MTTEELVRRMLTEAVAADPEPARTPFEQVLRRRRRRPLRAAVVATALLLTAAVAVAGVRGLGTKPTMPAAPAVPTGWKLFQNRAYNLQFRYPPDWVVGGRGGFVIAPRKLSPTGSRPSTIAAPGPLFISLGLSSDYTSSSSRTVPSDAGQACRGAGVHPLDRHGLGRPRDRL